ncbi:MAG: hypothetical protein ACK4P5_10395, partial [Fimbriimonadales bacterium]
MMPYPAVFVERKPCRNRRANPREWATWHGGGGMSQKQPPYHHLLRDLPQDLQKAIHEAVAACQPCFRPRLYASDWQEELYHEAACAA